MDVPFSKFQAAGNDFILLNNTAGTHALTRATRLRMCHRRLGIGADGLIEILQSDLAQFRMVYYNADGVEGSLCGNGARCALAFALKMGLTPGKSTDSSGLQADRFLFEASDGVHVGGIFRHVTSKAGDSPGYECYVIMNDVSLSAVKLYENGDLFLNTGSPHHVRFVPSKLQEMDVVNQGRDIRWNWYGEEGCNVNFVCKPVREGANVSRLQTCGNDEKEVAVLFSRTYERGVEDETWACGTGSVAVAISDFILTLVANNRLVTVPDHVASSSQRLQENPTHENDEENAWNCEIRIIEMKGGQLRVAFKVKRLAEASSPMCLVFSDVTLSGQAEHVFDGLYRIECLSLDRK